MADIATWEGLERRWRGREVAHHVMALVLQAASAAGVGAGYFTFSSGFFPFSNSFVALYFAHMRLLV